MDKLTSIAEPSRTSGLELILAERKRQVEGEGFNFAHDDKYTNGELTRAASCYEHAQNENSVKIYSWPWNEKWWKPKDRISNLIRAGALYLAEAERLERKGEAMKAKLWKQRVDAIAMDVETEMKVRIPNSK
jgi:hypothetical protein